MTIGAYSAVRVADLEVAMVLAKEFRPASGRASLTLGQLQTVFGASYLDSAERERIAAALEAAGLRSEPSVLDAHPDEALVFTVNGNGAASEKRHFARKQPSKSAAALPAAPAAAAPAAATPRMTAIVLGMLLPVLFTSVAGWRFGLSFVAFTAIAAGVLSRSGPAALLRSGRTFLLAVGGLCLLSLLAAVALAAGGGSPH